MTPKEIINKGIEAGQFPRYIYKFFAFNEFFIDSIKNSYIWFSKPIDFNDPFDGGISLQWNGTPDQYENYLQGASQGRIPGEKIKELAKKMYLNPQITKDQLDGVLSETINRIGVACFSEINTNILMWSHYANCHKGVCIKYDLGKMAEDFQFLVKVKYESDYPLYNYLSTGSRKDLSKVVIGTKSKDWSYEQEFRILSSILGKNSIQKHYVDEVIFGCRCTKQTQIIDLFKANGYDPTYSKTKKKDFSFGLDILNYA